MCVTSLLSLSLSHTHTDSNNLEAVFMFVQILLLMGGLLFESNVLSQDDYGFVIFLGIIIVISATLLLGLVRSPMSHEGSLI